MKTKCPVGCLLLGKRNEIIPNQKVTQKSGVIVSLAGPGIGVLFSLEQWTYHPRNYRHLFGSRYVLSYGHAAPPCNPKDPFTIGSLLTTGLVTEAHRDYL